MNGYDSANRFGTEVMDNALRSMSVVTKGFQQIAAETGDFAKRSFEQSSEMFEKLAQVRTVDKAVELQTAFARTACERWVTQANRMAGLYSELARDAYEPFEATARTTVRTGEETRQGA